MLQGSGKSATMEDDEDGVGSGGGGLRAGVDDYAGEAALTPQSASLMQRLDEYEEAASPSNPPSPSERHPSIHPYCFVL